MATLNFNAATIEPTTSFEAIPAGWYNCIIMGSEMKPTKDGQNQYLRLTLKVLDGQYANRQLFDNLNLTHSNPVAVEIAQRKLSAYCHATGVIQVQDSSQLHGIPFKARVSIRPADGQYEASNDIKDVKHAQDPSAGPVGGGAPQPQANPAQAGFGQPVQGFGQPAQLQPSLAPVNPAQQHTQPIQPQNQPAAQAVQQTPFTPETPAPSNPSTTTSPSEPWQPAAAVPQEPQLQPAPAENTGDTPPWA